MAYYACTDQTGAVRIGEIPHTIEVFARFGDPVRIGHALSVGTHKNGAELWRLTVRKVEVPGRFILVRGEFQPVK